MNVASKTDPCVVTPASKLETKGKSTVRMYLFSLVRQGYSSESIILSTYFESKYHRSQCLQAPISTRTHNAVFNHDPSTFSNLALYFLPSLPPPPPSPPLRPLKLQYSSKHPNLSPIHHTLPSKSQPPTSHPYLPQPQRQTSTSPSGAS